MTSNPLLSDWTDQYGLPPFGLIKAEHFEPAFEEGFRAHRAEIAAIAASADAPTFANTIATLDRSGRLLSRVAGAFFNLVSSMGTEELLGVETRVTPKFAAHRNELYLNQDLFRRVDALYQERESLGLKPVDKRLLERVHLDFVMAGAKLDKAAKARYAEVTEREAALETAFSQMVLADEDTWILLLDNEGDLAGLSPDFRAVLAEGATARKHEGSHAVVLSMSVVETFLAQSERRDLREQVWRAWTGRGVMAPERQTYPLILELLSLRNEQARLHGYRSYADYALVDRMAKTPDAVAKLLERIWEGAVRKAGDEEAQLAAYARAHGQEATLEPWDWRYWSEKVRMERYELDDGEIKPYFQLENMIAAMFDCAGRLFGIDFVEQKGLTLYHPDARLWEVRSKADGSMVGVFVSDNFARPGKRGGAWMSTFREQSIDADGVRIYPLVINNNNIAKAPAGQATLLSFDDVRTLFHEFGHGLHGLLSSIEWERLSGTNVLRDFVELPSQIFEHWALESEVLARFAVRASDGKAIPPALVEKIKAASKWNQGFLTVQLTGSALLDMSLHRRAGYEGFDLGAFQDSELARLGVPATVGIRHRLSHFRHLFSDSSYAAGYYVYQWAEVLDADGFEAFVEAGNPFDPATAARLKEFVYAAGNSGEPGELYRKFRGRDPRVEALLADRGLLDVAG